LEWSGRFPKFGSVSKTCSIVVEQASLRRTRRWSLMPFPVSLFPLFPFPLFSPDLVFAPKHVEQQQRNLEQKLDFRSRSLPLVGLGDPMEAIFAFIWLIRFVSCLSIWWKQSFQLKYFVCGKRFFYDQDICADCFQVFFTKCLLKMIWIQQPFLRCLCYSTQAIIPNKYNLRTISTWQLDWLNK